MRYSEVIDWLNTQDPPILNEHEQPHSFGDDIAQSVEEENDERHNKAIF